MWWGYVKVECWLVEKLAWTGQVTVEFVIKRKKCLKKTCKSKINRHACTIQPLTAVYSFFLSFPWLLWLLSPLWLRLTRTNTSPSINKSSPYYQVLFWHCVLVTIGCTITCSGTFRQGPAATACAVRWSLIIITSKWHEHHWSSWYNVFLEDSRNIHAAISTCTNNAVHKVGVDQTHPLRQGWGLQTSRAGVL